jgi:hypothetical protein
MLKNKYFTFLTFLLIFLFLSSGLALALEIKYPAIPGLPSINQNKPDINAFIGYFFGLGIYLVGILSLISFTMGAVGLINPNVEAHKDAKDRMIGAILGLVLTLASFVIIKTINPALITPTLTPLPGVAGIFYTNNVDQKTCPEENPNTVTIPEGFNNIQYSCTDNSESNPVLLVWMFPGTDYTGNNGTYDGVTVQRVTCNNKIPINAKSFRMKFETPGIYFCMGGCNGNICSGYMSDSNTVSQDNIGAPFSGKIGGVRIVNGTTGGPYYGVIFHKETGLGGGGTCTTPKISTNPGISCQNISDVSSTSAVDIFALNSDPISSGDGVNFYSEPFGWNTGANAGFTLLPNNQIGFSDNSMQAKNLAFNYADVDRPQQYQDKCVTFSDCPGSLKINGNYLVGLYSGSSYCQTFTSDAVNLNAQPIIASGGTGLTSIYVIPVQ